MHEDAAGVADGFAGAAEGEGEHVGPGAVAGAEDDVGDGEEAEGCAVEGVDWETWIVAVD